MNEEILRRAYAWFHDNDADSSNLGAEIEGLKNALQNSEETAQVGRQAITLTLLKNIEDINDPIKLAPKLYYVGLMAGIALGIQYDRIKSEVIAELEAGYKENHVEEP